MGQPRPGFVMVRRILRYSAGGCACAQTCGCACAQN